MFFKKILPLFMISLFIIGAVGCSKVEKPQAVAIVNGEIISLSDFESYVEDIKMSFQQQGMDLESEEGKEYIKQIEQEILDNMINQQVLQQEAANKGYITPDAIINENMDQIKGQFADEKEFKQALKDNNLTESKLREHIANETSIQQYIDAELSDISVTEEELKKEYDFYKEQSGDLPPLDEIRTHLEQEIKSQKTQEKIGALIEELKSKSTIEIFYK